MSQENTLNTSVDDWQAEMAKFTEGKPGKTLRELSEELNVPRSTLRERLTKLIETGRCTKGIGKRLGVGGVYSVSVYQLKKEEN